MLCLRCKFKQRLIVQVFWISYEDLLRNYQHFDRTRLFGPEWTITQQWTSVDVPWSVDYLDTKFRIVIPTAGSVVIVLSQLDDRYFRGLEGQYDFNLQFRLHKDDEDEYIVRSNAAYYMKRSVSTELELEAGNYWVLLKITAKRYAESPTVSDIVSKTCELRPKKLLSVGLSYDMAHAKGNFRELEAAREARAKAEKKAKKKEFAKKMHAARAKERRKAKLRAIKRDMKKQEKLQRRMAEEAEYRAREEAAFEAARRLEETRVPDPTQGGPVNGAPAAAVYMERTYSPKHIDSTFPPPNGRSASPFRPPGMRRDTLTVQTHRQSTYPTYGTPDIRVQRASFGHGGTLTLSDISDDELSWDSELDGPDDMSDSEMLAADPPATATEDNESNEDDADPWNAVCVIGLRVYSQGQEVQIEVIRGDNEDNRSNMDDDLGIKILDVDDSAKDAVELRSPVSSPITPAVMREISMSSLEGMIL
jgi:hypothetical protein